VGYLRVEGNFVVAWVQATFGSPELTVYFSAVYVYGYVFLLAFPFLAYLALPRTTTLKRLVVAYALNYAIGLVLYTVVLAYGPRNVMPDMVTPLLFTHNPGIMALTGEINEATNVFPAAHVAVGDRRNLRGLDPPGVPAVDTDRCMARGLCGDRDNVPRDPTGSPT